MANTKIENQTIHADIVQQADKINNYGIPLEQLIELAKKLGVVESERDEWIRKYQDLEKTITNRHDETAKQAKAFLDKGDLVQAEKLFKQSLTSKLAIVKEAAVEAFALAQIKDLQYETQAAIGYYQQSLQLDPDNADGWNRLGRLFRRVGELDQAMSAYQTVVNLGQKHNDQQEIAIAYANLGSVYNTRGKFDKAIEMFQEYFAITKSLGNKKSIAVSYIKLGIDYQTFGELDKAIEYHQKALQLGTKEEVGAAYGNLGLVYYRRGELDKAVEMYNEALTISQKLGNKENMATICNNLGIMYKTRDELDKAVEMHNKALTINKQIDNKEGMADTYAYLGNVYKLKGNKAEAQCYWQKSIELYKYIGSPEWKDVQKWLDNLK
jgi:tetratricopeptide (TPR) repeat protein